MVRQQVTVQNGEYFCDIDITVEEWKTILTDKKLMSPTRKNILAYIYTEPGHKSTCKALSEKYGESPQHFNSNIMHFAKKVQKRLNRFEVFGTDGKLTYWIIPMQGKFTGKYFEWTLRPELTQAMKELKMTKPAK